MIDALLAHLDTTLLYVFAAGALLGSVLMIVLRTPMHVATALISTMVFLGGIYGLLGVHFIAAFQVLIYVGAVMVFMVFVIMLLEIKSSTASPFSRLLLPGVTIGALLLLLLALAVWRGSRAPAALSTKGAFSLQEFSASFLSEYWLHFELTSVLLVAAVVAALAVVKGGPAKGTRPDGTPPTEGSHG